MATTLVGSQLTEAYRLRLSQLSAATLADVLPLLQLLDLDDIDRSWARIFPGLQAIIAERHRIAADVGANYFRAFRAVEGGAGDFAPIVAQLQGAKVAYNLELVGPIQTKRAIARNRPRQAEAAITRVSGEVTRLVLSGARETVTRSVLEDPAAIGYARASDGDPCAFCAMLIGRGRVYRSATVDFEAHSHCGCVPEPAYSPGTARPGRGEDFARLWDESTRGLGGEDAIRAFRAAYEGRS